MISDRTRNSGGFYPWDVTPNIYPQPSWPWTGANAPLDPFAKKVATKPADIRVVKLNSDNLALVVWYMLQSADSIPVYIPSTRDHIEWSDMLFSLGQWIVHEKHGVVSTFRPANSEEKDTYGLD